MASKISRNIDYLHGMSDDVDNHYHEDVRKEHWLHQSLYYWDTFTAVVQITLTVVVAKSARQIYGKLTR